MRITKNETISQLKNEIKQFQFIASSLKWRINSPSSIGNEMKIVPKKYFVCGKNDQGQLGIGDKTNRNTLTEFKPPVPFISIANGYDQTLGLSSNGSVWLWGNGQLIPKKVDNLKDIISVSSGYRHMI